MSVLIILFDLFLIFLILYLLLRIVKKSLRRSHKNDVIIPESSFADKDSHSLENEATKEDDSLVEDSSFVPPHDMTQEERKGYEGEQVLYDQIKQVQNVGAKVIWDCWLRYPNGRWTQADIILIWKTGVYVIESKNWTGCRVYGSRDDKNWTVCWFDWKGNAALTLRKQNPILQNVSHVDCIRKMIYNLAPIYSIIAFHDSCTLAKKPEKTKDTAVINYSELRQTIADFHISGDKKRLSLNDVNLIYERLKACNDKITEEEKSLHKKEIREKYNNL